VSLDDHAGSSAAGAEFSYAETVGPPAVDHDVEAARRSTAQGVRRRLGGDHMIVTHAIFGPVGAAMLLLAALGLLVGVVVLRVSAARTRGRRQLTSADAVPLWWDQSPAAAASARASGSPTRV
jgi:hypothetical protein